MSRGRGSGGRWRARGVLGACVLGAVAAAPAAELPAPPGPPPGWGAVRDTGVLGQPPRPRPVVADTGVVGRVPPAPLGAGEPPVAPPRLTCDTTTAPGWAITIEPQGAGRYQLHLQRGALIAGGEGEAPLAFAQCGQQLAQAHGGGAVEIVQYQEGLASGLFGARRVASGVIQLRPPPGAGRPDGRR